MCQFIEGVLDVYHTYISTPFNILKDDCYFYIKGYSFNVMFTHEKGGKRICLGSFPSDLLNQLKQDDVLYTRMKDEDEDDLVEEDLLSYRSSSRCRLSMYWMINSASTHEQLLTIRIC